MSTAGVRRDYENLWRILDHSVVSGSRALAELSMRVFRIQPTLNRCASSPQIFWSPEFEPKPYAFNATSVAVWKPADLAAFFIWPSRRLILIRWLGFSGSDG